MWFDLPQIRTTSWTSMQVLFTTHSRVGQPDEGTCSYGRAYCFYTILAIRVCV